MPQLQNTQNWNDRLNTPALTLALPQCSVPKLSGIFIYLIPHAREISIKLFFPFSTDPTTQWIAKCYPLAYLTLSKEIISLYHHSYYLSRSYLSLILLRTLCQPPSLSASTLAPSNISLPCRDNAFSKIRIWFSYYFDKNSSVASPALLLKSTVLIRAKRSPPWYPHHPYLFSNSHPRAKYPNIFGLPSLLYTCCFLCVDLSSPFPAFPG